MQNKILSLLAEIFVFVLVKISRFRKTFNQTGDNIVLISFHKLGDSVFTIPAINEIYKSVTGDIYILCFEETMPIFELNFKKEHLIPFQHSDFYLNNRIAGKIIRKKIRELNPEKILDLTGSVVSASVLFNSWADEIVGVNEEYYRPIYTRYTPIRKTPHIMDIYLDAIGIDDKVKSTQLKEFNVNINDRGYIAIHPFAGWKSKEWNLSKFIRLGTRLSDYYEVIFVCEPHKMEDDLRNQIITSGIKIVETRDIYELISLLKDCSIIVSNDSGPIYIANMLGKPTFTIYGPTNPLFHLPYGKYHRFIQKKIKCSPSPGNKYCFTNAGRMGCPSFECMNLLGVEEVFREVFDFLIELGIKQKKII